MTPQMASSAGGSSDLLKGATLQCLEAATLGMPFEVWKTRMGRHRSESTIEAFQAIRASKGLKGFWQGTSAKLVESASKGAILLYAKETLLRGCVSLGLSNTASGFVAGAGGGACQTLVMGPCTFAVTAIVNSTGSLSLGERFKEILKSQGVKGLYPGGSAIALRQMTNWASRQGFTEMARDIFLSRKRSRQLGEDKVSPPPLKLTVPQELVCGCVGGALSTWNQPLEVARIQMQSAAAHGLPRQNILQVFQTIVQTDGPTALLKGIVPRIGLGIWQTLFMVSGAKLVGEILGW